MSFIGGWVFSGIYISKIWKVKLSIWWKKGVIEDFSNYRDVCVNLSLDFLKLLCLYVMCKICFKIFCFGCEI